MQAFGLKQTFQPLNHANLECLKKSSQKPGDFHNMCQTKLKRQIIFVMVFLTLSAVSVVLSCCSFGSDEKILSYYQ